ncbi:MAG: hypothetical protein LHV69_02785 [Elusimicrobia bacterium]|nr:hypothetical protein [Candidatus Obscuribacterium magneticum]
MRKILFSLIGLLFLHTTGWADVTVVRWTTSSGFRGFGGSEVTETKSIRGIRSREESRLKLKGLVGKVAKPADTVTLMLLDKSIEQRLDMSKKTYQESSLKKMGASLEGATGETGANKEEKKAAPTHRVVNSTFKVTPTNQSKTINGFPCREYKIDTEIELEELATKERSKTRLLQTLWTTPETPELKQLRKEEQALFQAYVKALGVEVSPGKVDNMGTLMAVSLMGADEKEVRKTLAKVSDEMKKVKGETILSQADWYEEKEASSTKGKKGGEEVDEGAGVDTSGGVKGALGSFASKMAAKQVKKKMEASQKAKEGQPAFSVTSEIKSVSVKPVPDSSFEIPAGFKKVVDK